MIERLNIWLVVVADIFTVGVLLAVAWLSLVIFSPAYAADVFADIGQSEYALPDNGIYWQDGHRSDQDMKSLYLRIGVEHHLAKWLSVSGSAFSLGKYHLEAEATPADADYNPGTPNYCNGPCPPLNRWTTSGNIQGLSLTVKAQYEGFFIELGPTYNYQTLSMHVFYNDGSDVLGYHVDNARERGFGYTTGIGYERDRFRFGVVAYHFDHDYSDVRFIEPTMPGGVTTAYAGYVGWRF